MPDRSFDEEPFLSPRARAPLALAVLVQAALFLVLRADRIEEFDPELGAWRTLATPLPLDPHEVQAFTWRDKLAFASTWNERGVFELALLDPLGVPPAF